MLLDHGLCHSLQFFDLTFEAKSTFRIDLNWHSRGKKKQKKTDILRIPQVFSLGIFEDRWSPRYARLPAMTGRPRRGDEVTTRDRPVGEAGGSTGKTRMTCFGDGGLYIGIVKRRF